MLTEADLVVGEGVELGSQTRKLGISGLGRHKRL